MYTLLQMSNLLVQLYGWLFPEGFFCCLIGPYWLERRPHMWPSICLVFLGADLVSVTTKTVTGIVV